ncbi:MAG: ABC transporter ATP-binding protein [Planctomycetota bacterium]
MSSAVSLRGLTKRFGNLTVVEGLDLEIEAGIVFGFLGLNGAGKTTTIRMLTGLSKPTAGEASILGHRIGQRNPRAHELFGYLPESPSFYPWMKAHELLRWIGRLRGLSPQASRQEAARLLDELGLGKASGRRIGGFSRGMRQRLGLAVAMTARPPLLILDEPGSALDPVGRAELLQIVRRLRGAATIFFSSHILAEVERVVDAVGILHHGRLLVVATRDELDARLPHSIFLLQIEGNAEPLVARLESLPGVTAVERGEAIRVHTRDPDLAKRELPRAVAELGLPLVRFELVRPTLEDVFLRVVQPEVPT